MILRVPDYFDAFACTAGWCKDSCCIGWEINIDEDTAEYYRQVPGEMGERLRREMYTDEEGIVSFQLGDKKRCPFLNGGNLCDICTCLGEEMLSEVCTEYPRFSLYYADVLQKCLSLSCEEAGRILFSKEEPVRFVEYRLPSEEMEEADEEACGEEESIRKLYESVQNRAIGILQNREKSIEERMEEYLAYLWDCRNRLQECKDRKPEFVLLQPTYEEHRKRMEIFEELEVLDQEWEDVKAGMKATLSVSTYHDIFLAFKTSAGYLERDYENLLVYFTFRYFMNAYYDTDVLSYGKLAVVFTLMVRDMDMLYFVKNGGAFSRADRVDTARIFSKEVEHSEENVEYVREELLFA